MMGAAEPLPTRQAFTTIGDDSLTALIFGPDCEVDNVKSLDLCTDESSHPTGN